MPGLVVITVHVFLLHELVNVQYSLLQSRKLAFRNSCNYEVGKYKEGGPVTGVAIECTSEKN